MNIQEVIYMKQDIPNLGITHNSIKKLKAIGLNASLDRKFDEIESLISGCGKIL
jgi:hypothetical protein